MTYLLAFAVSFVYVALRAFQQLNVQHDRYKWIIPASLGMALCEATIIVQIVNQGITLALPIGIGASLGCMAAMQLHKRIRSD